MAALKAHTGATTSLYSPAGTATLLRSRKRRVAFPSRVRVSCSTVVIGLGGDSGCGKRTFVRRLASVLGDGAAPPRGGNPESNTLVGDTATVICLDDYHSLDRPARKARGLTALDPRANDFDLMYEQVKAIKEGRAVEKPVYNHVTGLLDAPELVRDMAERGQSLGSITASIEARKPDFDAYIDPQKQYADAVIEVLPTKLIPDEEEVGKVLRVRLIMKEDVKHFAPVYLFDEGSTINWIPCGRKLSCSYPGIRFAYGFGTYFGHEVSVLEMDGQFDRLEELLYVETHLSNLSTKFYGEATQQMLSHADFPGSNNGTGLFQTILGFKIRDLYEQIVAERDAVAADAVKA
ncbi:hypothetical protein HU200_010783 [Digitaria exilis]|uniref:Phosphoribulokinase/uridine kinase domain-containing protein n=1 Tax=Digitaria exilis TaxID=1010633 RepID=A0A835KN81_9POAL|nr:hypothetical protein HU200_010783 [Digitaria exilis]CAB3485621.1 unnamed protein product [Digitaria exilis]